MKGRAAGTSALNAEYLHLYIEADLYLVFFLDLKCLL